MKIRDALLLIQTLRNDKKLIQALCHENPYGTEHTHYLGQIKAYNKEIYRIDELIQNCELDDSYSKDDLNFLEKYEGENGK